MTPMHYGGDSERTVLAPTGAFGPVASPASRRCTQPPIWSAARSQYDGLSCAPNCQVCTPPHAGQPGDPALVLYTSGSPGALKAVEHTQASFAAITASILASHVSPLS